MEIAPASVAVIVMVKRIAVLHMRQLMRHDAGHLLIAQLLEQPGGGGHRGVLRVAAGGEGVGLRVVDQIDLRHRQAARRARSRTMA